MKPHKYGILEWSTKNFQGRCCTLIKKGTTLNWRKEAILKENELTNKKEYTIVFY